MKKKWDSNSRKAGKQKEKNIGEVLYVRYGILLRMPERIKIPPLLPEHRAEILRGLDGILSQEHLVKTWEMISRRYAYYEAL